MIHQLFVDESIRNKKRGRCSSGKIFSPFFLVVIFLVDFKMNLIIFESMKKHTDWNKMETKEQKKKRIIMAFAGVCISGFSVGLFRLSLFGTDPFQCFANGIANAVTNVFPIGFGTLYTIINLLMLILIFILNKHYIGIATFINIFGTGYMVELSLYLLGKVIVAPGIVMRVVLLLVGIVIICFASSLYYTADLGVSTYDAIALILRDKKIAKFQYCRIATDLVCVIIGFLLGAIIGVGTLITAFFMGPLIEFFNEKIAKPLLFGKKQNQ